MLSITGAIPLLTRSSKYSLLAISSATLVCFEEAKKSTPFHKDKASTAPASFYYSSFYFSIFLLFNILLTHKLLYARVIAYFKGNDEDGGVISAAESRWLVQTGRENP